ncbi:MAG TPA: orotidine-5'-phosphate decarboxylase [Dehalococcoidia bacterium]|nr:orotidine-5'-phosphate decarboxylase [Dehalococcoidia bacterium]
MGFLEKLLEAARTNGSLLCVGLDPDPELMPAGMGVLEFNRAIVDATSDLVCAYKPNLAFYEALGTEGLRALEKTVTYIPDTIPVIGDAKRGDIGSTARAYARALFETLGFDAATVNPYMGYDSLEPFIEYREKGVFILCRTSNAGSVDFQDLVLSGKSAGVEGGERPLFEVVALRAREWNALGNVGLVVGSTYPQELRRVRQLCPQMPLLIPGIGAQGGDPASAVRYGVDARGEKAIISSSRQIIYAYLGEGGKGGDFAAAARGAALKLRDEINRYRGHT